jgi:membrane protease YdiL (CAAX protease family)
MLPGKPWSYEALSRLLMGLLVCFLAIGLVAYVAEQRWPGSDAETRRMWREVGGTVVFQTATCALVGWSLREQGMNWREAFGLSTRRWWRTLWLAALTVGALVPVCVGLILVTLKLMAWGAIAPQVQTMVRAVEQAATWPERGLLSITAVVLAPLWEELFFRGILFTAIRQAGFPRLGLWFSSLLFAGIHWNVLIFVPLVVFSAAMTWLYVRTENLLAAIMAHALFNGANLAYMLLGGSLV